MSFYALFINGDHAYIEAAVIGAAVVCGAYVIMEGANDIKIKKLKAGSDKWGSISVEMDPKEDGK